MAAGWQRTEPSVWIVSQAFRCMGSSNICELGFQRLRSKEKKGSNDNCKLSSPSQWARLIDSKVSATWLSVLLQFCIVCLGHVA